MIKTYADFITQIEGVYGLYNPAQKAELIIYLPAKIGESELKNLYWKIREEYSAVYKTPPDITQINNLLRKPEHSLEAEANIWYDKLTRTGNSLDNVIISDLRAQGAVEFFGGWAAFCQRNPEYESLHRKNFIGSFMKLDKEACTNIHPAILYGESTRRNKPPLMFGDKEKCSAILGSYKNDAMKLVGDMTREIQI